jgi:phosphoribosylformylglycinamidine synthase
MPFKAAVIVYPGSNCDRDCKIATETSVPGAQVIMVWHGDTKLPHGLDLVIIPGGFSYGDYLRSGAMAARAAIMPAIAAFAQRGGSILGICNGFQILCESGLLPGALTRNEKLKYVCKPINLQVSNPNTRFTSAYKDMSSVTMTQGNGDGCFRANSETLKALQDQGQIAFRYSNNPNGSMNDIAGITNQSGNILGLMPHPDRAFDKDLGYDDGALMFQSLAHFHNSLPS